MCVIPVCIVNSVVVMFMSCGLTLVILADEKMLLVVDGLVVVHCVVASPAASCRRGLGGGKCRPSSVLGEGIGTN